MLAQGVSNPMERKHELDKLKFHPFSSSEDLKLGAKKLTMKPYNSFQKNIGLYKGPNKLLSIDSVSQNVVIKNLQLNLAQNMPILVPQKKYYMPTVDPIDPAIHHHILIGKVGKTLLDQE